MDLKRVQGEREGSSRAQVQVRAGGAELSLAGGEGCGM